MAPRQRLAEADRLILDTLTCRVRIASEAQLQDACGGGVRRPLSRLQQHGFLSRATVAVRLPAVAEPLLIWTPGDRAPDAGALAWQLQKRWTGIAPQVSTVWWATARAARLMGGVGGRLRQPLQVAHDLGVAAVYFNRLSAGRQGVDWIGEDRYRREFKPARREKVADAVELTPSGEITRAIEFGGAYPARRVMDFHRYWSRRQVPYELW